MLQRIGAELDTQFKRYQNSKYGKVFAILIYYLVFTGSPMLVRFLVPSMKLMFSQNIISVLFTIGAILLTEIFWCFFMLIVYRLKHPFFEQYRIHPKKQWPWEENKEKWSKLQWRSLGITYFHILIFAPLNLFIATKLGYSLVISPEEIPSLSWMLPQFIVMMFIEDTIFFWFHWALHHPSLYNIHKIHHQFTTSVSLAGFHFHIIEFFLVQSLSFLLNSFIAKLYGPLHVSTVISWFFFRTWDANTAHSGYNFSWTPLQLLPFCANDDFHDFHHSNNAGNYASHFRFSGLISSSENLSSVKSKVKELEKMIEKKNFHYLCSFLQQILNILAQKP